MCNQVSGQDEEEANKQCRRVKDASVNIFCFLIIIIDSLFSHHSLSRIQSLFRGYRIRKFYHELKLTIPPKDIEKRKQWFYNKVKKTI
jgi:hypothetical protein